LTGGRRIGWVAAGLAVLLTLPSLSIGLVQDDLTLYGLAVGWPPDSPVGTRAPWDLFRFYADPEVLVRMRDRGLAPWWASSELRLAFFRPLSSLWHWLDFRWFGALGWPHHAMSVAVYGAAALAVAAVHRRLEPDPRVAGLAAVLWAIDDAHGMTVGWIANRNAVLAWALGASALALHDRWRRDGWRPGAVAAPLVAALALGAGEAALGAWAWFLSYALFVDRGAPEARLGSVLPYGLVLVLWRAIYVAGGYGTTGSTFYVDPGSDPIGFLGVLPLRAATLLAAELGPVPADLSLVLSGTGAHAVYAACVLASLAAVGWVLVPLLRDDRARFWAFGMVLSCVPVAATWPSERLLGFAGIGGAALIARVLASPASRWVRGPLLGVHVGLAALLLPARSVAIGVPGAQQRALGASIPDVAGKELVVVAAPDWLLPTFGVLHHALDGGAPGTGLRHLVSTSEPFAAERPDAHTLILSSEAGFGRDPLAGLVRDVPLVAGDTVRVDGWRIEVLATDGDGRPTRVSFASDRPLDDDRRVWTTWDGDRLVPFVLPDLGRGG
jgi:hypothetical protein